MDAIKTLKSKDKTLKIFQDDNAQSPREWDNLAKMIFFGKQEHLGDKHQYLKVREFNSREDFIKRGAEQLVKEMKDVAIIKAVHIYDHSGVSISTSFGYPFNCKWDSGTIGFAVVTKADIRKEYGVKRITQKHIEQATKILDGEVETLNQYVTGDVYGFKLFDEKGEEEDSCWGFFGIEHIKDEFPEFVEA